MSKVTAAVVLGALAIIGDTVLIVVGKGDLVYVGTLATIVFQVLNLIYTGTVDTKVDVVHQKVNGNLEKLIAKIPGETDPSEKNDTAAVTTPSENK